MIMRRLYSLSISLFKFGIQLASLFNDKAAKWVKGRRNWQRDLSEAIKGEKNLFWLHCSSLGEFEQGRPVIEELHRNGIKVLLTFFSPSGYENQKNFAAAFHVSYLPADTLSNAKEFVKIVRPKAVFFVKYEFWFNYMSVLKKENIPLFIVSGIFRKDQYFFKSHGRWFADQLKQVQHYFLQNEESKELLKTIDIDQCSISGDTRFDRVTRIVSNPMKLDAVRTFKGKAKLFIGGSTWDEDEKIIKQAYDKFKELKFIIAPHEVSETRIKEINQRFNNEGILLSELTEHKSESRLLIVDSIGKLSSLYQYADMAFIGGGFGKGIHNTLEAAAYGLPLAFGPNFGKFQEAKDLLKRKGALSVRNQSEMIQAVKVMLKDNQKMGETNKAYVLEKQGATSKIMSELKRLELI